MVPPLTKFTRAAGTSARAGKAGASRLRRAGSGISRVVGRARTKGGAGEVGMMRLLDLHAASCAGDTLVAIGLAGTIFFSVPVGEARSRVALYLLLTMAPFALLAPIVGPVLDHFRHGRRYALAVTMLGRAFLAFMIADHLADFALYPAAFGMLVLSRAYGVARSAAVPRVLPKGLGLVEAGARASLFGTVAGALVAPIGLALGWIGTAWTLRAATAVFLLGMVVALRLPPKADSDPPETIPRLLHVFRRKETEPVLKGELVWTAIAGSSALRALYGFLTLFLAFRIRMGDFTGVREPVALGVLAAGLGIGSLTATVILTRMGIRRPLLLQACALAVPALIALLATLQYSLWTVALLCLAGALGSGLAKLAVDAVIQDRLPERVRASAFARSETLLMLAWVVGGGLGLIPFAGSVGLGIAAAGMALAAAQIGIAAVRLRSQRLAAHPGAPAEGEVTQESEEPPTQELPTADTETTKELANSEDEPVYHLYRPSQRREESV